MDEKEKKDELAHIRTIEHIIRNLIIAGGNFQKCQYERCSCGKCQYERCSCGQIKENCRKRWERWQLALETAQDKVRALKNEILP